MSDSNIAPRALEPLRTQDRDYRTETPVSADVFQAYLGYFEYEPAPLDPTVDTVEETSQWTKERITYSAAYGADRAIAYLWTPKNAQPPFQTVVMYPGSTDFLMESSENMSQYGTMVQFFPRGGRAVLYPIYKGTYERNSTVTYSDPDMSLDYRDHVVMWAQDIMRGIDYLDSRDDTDATKVAYFGYSWGGEVAPIMTAVEERFRAAILAVAGLPRFHARPEADPINYAPHVTIPTLMLGGHLDYIFPLETSQRPMYELLGTPDSEKEFIEYEEAAHNLWPLYRNEMIRRTLEWLDEHLGPVEPR